jgi:hypothetical protein
LTSPLNRSNYHSAGGTPISNSKQIATPPDFMPKPVKQRATAAAGVLRAKALHGRPSLDHAIDREVIVRQQRLDARVGQQCLQEAAGNVAFHETVAVLGEHRHVPDRRIHRQPDEPADH